MDDERYVVIELDLLSDEPCIPNVWGVFNLDEARDFAYVQVRNAFRGMDLRVVQLKRDPNDV
jgi:hypothetical protein